MANVKFIKLINGDDIVGDLIFGKDGDKTITVKDAAKFVMAPQGVGMIPFAPFSKSETFTIKTEHVLCMGDVEEEIYNAWSAQFSESGIILAGADVKKAAKTLKISKD